MVVLDRGEVVAVVVVDDVDDDLESDEGGDEL